MHQLIFFGSNSKMDIQDTRKANLITLIGDPRKRGAVARFSKSHNLNPAQISQIIKGKRAIGEKLARKLEDSIGLEPSSAPGFDHSIDGAIKKNIDKVSKCGATNAYIESRHTDNDMGFKGASHVTLVGFNYKK